MPQDGCCNSFLSFKVPNKSKSWWSWQGWGLDLTLWGGEEEEASDGSQDDIFESFSGGLFYLNTRSYNIQPRKKSSPYLHRETNFSWGSSLQNKVHELGLKMHEPENEQQKLILRLIGTWLPQVFGLDTRASQQLVLHLSNEFSIFNRGQCQTCTLFLCWQAHGWESN